MSTGPGSISCTVEGQSGYSAAFICEGRTNKGAGILFLLHLLLVTMHVCFAQELKKMKKKVRAGINHM